MATLIVEPTDTWFATDDADPNGGTPAIVHLVHSDYALSAQPSSVSVTEDNVEWSFDITLQAGEVARLASFTITGATRQAALDAVAALITSNSFDGQASTFLSLAELLTIRNFQFAQAPTDIQLSNSNILENNAAGATIGQFTTIDANTPYGDTFTYTLASGVGDQDNAIFEIVGAQLRVRESLDFETKSSYSLRMRSTDDAGLFIEKSFSISVTDRDENIPTVLSTSFLTTGYALTGDTSLTVTFSEPLVGGSDVNNYELRAADADGLLLQNDSVVHPTSVTWSGNTAALVFASGFVKDTYRLTLRDMLADDAGNALDGNGDTLAGGDWRRDFVVLATAIAPISRLSNNAGTQANDHSFRPSISADGRFVAFTSRANNLVAGDTNGWEDIFVKDTLTGAISRVSTDNVGAQANNYSYEPSISADGRFVSFTSYAKNLVAGDTNSWAYVYIKDTLTGVISLLSTDNAGNHPNSSSSSPSISADGRFVAFSSYASNLVAGDTNGWADVFVRDTLTGAIRRVSTDNAGNQVTGDSMGPSISADGRFVAFVSQSSNLVAGNTNGNYNIFVKDTQTGAISRISTGNAGIQANGNSSKPSISADGQFVAFYSYADNLVAGDTNGWADVFVKDTLTGAISRVSTNELGTQADSPSYEPSISAAGRFVAFTSSASNLVAGDTNGTFDLFVKDTQTGAISRISTGNAENQVTGDSVDSSISADGRYVAFTSYANNLVAGDTNGVGDVFSAGNPFTSNTANNITTLTGPIGHTFDIDPRSINAGQLIQGSNNTFDGLNRLRVNDVNFVSTTESTFDDGDRTLVTDTSTMSGLDVHREITVPAIGSQDFARTIDVFTNSSSAAITVPVRLFGNLGSDDHTTVFATSDGDVVVEPTDTWFATDDADASGGAPAIVHWLRGENGLNLVPTSVAVTEDNVDWSFSLTVPAGATRRLATFTVLGNTRQQAIDAVNALQGSNSLAGQAAAFLTADELNSLANFQFDHAPTDIQLSANSIAENNAASAVIGNFSTSDLNAAFGDTFTYSLTAGIGDTDNAAFTIVGDQLRAGSAFDFETKSTYNIRVRSTDAAGSFTEKTFTISVTDLDENAPTVLSTSFLTTGYELTGTTSLTVTFSEQLVGGSNVTNYELRAAGSDGLLLQSDAVINPASVTWSGNIATLNFATELGKDTYRLTLRDTLADDSGNALDGDVDSLAGGDWRMDFVVVGTTQRPIQIVSSSSDGTIGNAGSFNFFSSRIVSSNGRFVTFSSDASNLTSGDNNTKTDIFLKDSWTGVTKLVSSTANGNQGNNFSQFPSISEDGRYVAFYSLASNLVAADGNNTYDIFVKDTLTGTLTLASSSSDGSIGNGSSINAVISADGRYVVFESDSTNLVPADENGQTDVFLKDIITGSITLISISPESGVGTNGRSRFPSISGDGNYVTFTSEASNLVAGDNNAKGDVFLKNLQSGAVTLVSTSSNGSQSNNSSFSPSLSSDGRYVAFYSNANNLVDGDNNGIGDVFLKDTLTGTTSLVSVSQSGAQANGGPISSFTTSISADGRYVAFLSFANNLVPNDNDSNYIGDIFIKDTVNGSIGLVTMSSSAEQGNEFSNFPSISSDGRYLAFYSFANNLVAGDSNNAPDVLLTSNPLFDFEADVSPLVAPSGLSLAVSGSGTNSGMLVHGSSNSFDGLNRLQVDTLDYATTTPGIPTNNGQGYQLGSKAVAGLGIQRTVTVPAIGSQDFARTIDVFTNSSSAAITVPVRLFGNLGSDDQTTVFATSDGDLIFESTDTWFATDDADADGGAPAIVHWLRGDNGLNLVPTSVAVTEDNVDWSFSLTVPAGATRRLATFTVLGNTRQQAIDAVNALQGSNSFAGQAAAFLTADELNSLANFQFDHAPTDIQLSANSIAENNAASAVIGTFSTSDLNAAFGDTFAYSLTAGTGDTDNAAFNIVGNQLRAGSAFDYETKSTYNIRVRSTDTAGLFTEKTFTISVADLDEIAPTVLSTSFLSSGFLVSGSTSLTVTFSEQVVGAENVNNYQLQFAGSDGLLLDSDARLKPTSIVVNGNVAILTIPRLFEDTWRLRVSDEITDLAGNRLAASNATTSGSFTADFVVTTRSNPVPYRWTSFNTYNQAQDWMMDNNPDMYGGVRPSSWTDGTADAGQMSTDLNTLATLFTNKGTASANANIMSDVDYTYSSTNGQISAALFRISNTTDQAITWTPSFFYSSFINWGEQASVALNGSVVWKSSVNGLGNGAGEATISMPIPANSTSTVIFTSSQGPISVTRSNQLGFVNDSLNLPIGLDFIDDIPVVAPYRWASFNTYDQYSGWMMNNSPDLYGGVAPSTWTDGNGTAGQMSTNLSSLASVFTKQGFAGTNANIVSETDYTYSSTNGQITAALFRIANTTDSPITWSPSFYYSSFPGFSEAASVALNGSNLWTSSANGGGHHTLTLSIPPNMVSSVIFTSSYAVPSGTRSIQLGFDNNSLSLPSGLSYVDDLPKVTPYRFANFNTYDQSTGWMMQNSPELFGGTYPSNWTDGAATAGQISTNPNTLAALFTNKGYAGSALNVTSETDYTYSSTNGQISSALFRIQNSTASPLTWTPNFLYSSFANWGEQASIAVDGNDVWRSTVNGVANGSGSALVPLVIPANQTSSVIFVSSYGAVQQTRSVQLGFAEGSFALPSGLAFVDDLDSQLNTTFELMSVVGTAIKVDARGRGTGQIISGSGRFANGLNQLEVDGTNFSANNSKLTDGGYTFLASSQAVEGIEIERQITVPRFGTVNFIRSIETVHNVSTVDKTASVRLFGNLGSDASTTVFATSDGDLIVEPTDTWFATDDADPNGGAPAIVHWLRGENGLNLVPTGVAVTEDNVDWSFSLTVPAGATRRLATFTVLGNTRQQAIDAVNALQGSNSFAGQAAAFLTADELNSLANFQFDHAPTDIQLSANSIAENNAASAVIGTFSTSDLNAAFGDTFAYSLTAGTGDTDNAAFNIVGNQLRAGSAFDYETKSTYNIRVRSTDAAGLFTEKTFIISVTDLDEIAPKVTGSSLGASGVAIAGLNLLAITFDEPLLGATNPANYELRRAGSDGLLSSSDAPIQPLSVTWNGQAYALKFEGVAALEEDTYRLTILDTITDLSGNALDGDNNNVAGGAWTTDFVVVDSDVRRVSVDEDGVEGNNHSADPKTSADGRYIAFTSMANNLVADDHNGTWDIFRKDTWTGEIVRVSTNSQGIEGNALSVRPAISANGQFVVFESFANNLVPDDVNATLDVFIKDLVTGELRRVSESQSGIGGNFESYAASISYDGTLIAFESSATNLVDGTDVNLRNDIFVKNWQTGAMVRVSNNLSGSPANNASNAAEISGDGKHVAFSSSATDLVTEDTNGFDDIFVVELLTNLVDASLSASAPELVSVSETGLQSNHPSYGHALSQDGRTVYFESRASSLVSGNDVGRAAIFQKDTVTGVIKIVSTSSMGAQANDDSNGASTNADGSFVVFQTPANSLVDEDSNGLFDVFVKDTSTGLTVRLSSQSLTIQGNNYSLSPSISADGRFITFFSRSSNLLTEGGDNNGTDRHFRRRQPTS